MPAQEDKELVQRFQKGEEGAFNELVRRYQQQVYQTAHRLLGSHEEAQDLSQDAFIKAYSSLRDFRGDASFSTWIYRIVVNLSLNALRKRKMRQIFSLESMGFSISSKVPAADEQIEKAELSNRLSRAIEKLPKKQKLVFTLRYFQNLPHAEIAKVLNRNVGTIKANYHQALRKLQKALR